MIWGLIGLFGIILGILAFAIICGAKSEAETDEIILNDINKNKELKK